MHIQPSTLCSDRECINALTNAYRTCGRADIANVIGNCKEIILILDSCILVISHSGEIISIYDTA